MRLKPKNTALNPKALLYKRFIGLEQSMSLKNVYKTLAVNIEDIDRYWVFDKDIPNFVQVDEEQITDSKVIVVGPTDQFQYYDKYFYFSVDKEWIVTTNSDARTNTLAAKFANVGRYQTHRYYYAGSFDFLIKGSIEGTTSAFIKGNILPLTSLNIKYYTDELHIDRDDLIVIDGRLFVVEDTEVVQKRQPKAFKIYSSTLNNIL